MPTTKASEEFEQHIHRICELLEDSGAAATWNDHIPDPDNLTQSRQIDVSIRRNEDLTLVECRQHKSPQDVQWIEELIGRRTSLGAQAVIAVSSSGFTSGAIAKAKKYGILMRDLQQLTDAEISSWGQRVDITLFFYQYSGLEVTLLLGHESIGRIDRESAQAELRCHPCFQTLFNAAARQLGNLNLVAEEPSGRMVEFGIKGQFDDLRLCGELVIEVMFKGHAQLIARNVAPPAVLAYGEPAKNSEQAEAIVENFQSVGRTSIVHSGMRISMLLDLSQLEMPPFCQFRFCKIKGALEMDHEVLELYGVEKLWVVGKGMKVTLCSAG